MSNSGFEFVPRPSARQQYLDRERAARDMYLAVVEHAHNEYLTGPYPDRPAYEVVERQAWATYYAAARDAWRDYQPVHEHLAPPPAQPPPASHPYPMSDESALSVGLPLRHEPDVRAAWDVLEKRDGLNCLECGIPWRQPSPLCPRLVYDVHPRQPAFTPHPGNGQPIEADQWPGNYLAAPPNPESGQ